MPSGLASLGRVQVRLDHVHLLTVKGLPRPTPPLPVAFARS
jgi:hypothetical protein